MTRHEATAFLRKPCWNRHIPCPEGTRQHKKVGHSSGISIISQNKPLNYLEKYGKIHGVKGTAHIGGNNHG